MKSPTPTKTKSIYGDYVGRREFDNYQQYRTFLDKNKDCLENEVLPTVQFLTERYHQIPDEEMSVPKLECHFDDIEVYSEVFPSPDKADHPITIITIAHNKGIQSFGLHAYTNDTGIKNLTYHHCDNERDLLTQYFNWKHKNPCDISTGWFYCDDKKSNTRGGFDLPYIINRTKKLFGDDTKLWKLLSPSKQASTWFTKDGIQQIYIAGVTILDYKAIYKWYSTNNLESGKLDYVAQLEGLGGKIDYGEYGNLRNLYKQNWQLYCEYNFRDAQLVQNIDKKCGYFALIQSLALLCKVPMAMYNSTTALIEGLMLTYYRRNNLCAPRLVGGSQEWYPAAFVKEPKKGLYNWVIDIDITSSYPTAIITLNISPETYFGRIIGFSEKHITDYRTEKGVHDKDNDDRPFYKIIVEYMQTKEFPPFYFMKNDDLRTIVFIEGAQLDAINQSLKKKLFCVAPCGSMFKNSPKGVIAIVEKLVFEKRKFQNGEKKRLYKEADKLKGKEKKDLLEKAKQKHDLQWALKILLNSVYGVMGVPYSRYFNKHAAEAITSTGRQTILDGQRYANELLNNPSDELLNILREIIEY